MNTAKDRRIVIDNFDMKESIGWFDGHLDSIIRLTFATPTSNKCISYFIVQNELVAFGKFLAERERDGDTILKIEIMDPSIEDTFREVKKELIHSYAQSVKNNER